MFESYVPSNIAVPFDQVRFIFLLLLCYPLGAVYHYGLHPSRTSVTLRHSVSVALGVLLGLLCYGWYQLTWLLAFTGVCYAMLRGLSPRVVHIYTIVFAMVCLSIGHVYRMVIDYEGWHVDFSVPLMVLVQKVSLTAFAVRDGAEHNDSDHKNADNDNVLTEVPTLLEYWSYNYNFHTFLSGPACTMREYLNFVDGSNLKATIPNIQAGNVKYPVSAKFLQAVAFGVLNLLLDMYCSVDSILDPGYSLSTRILLMHMLVVGFRARYYCAWLLAESINNFVGLGFRGYDKNGKPVWDVCKNVRFWDVEFGTNFRSIITGWNITTSLWLRRICYKRFSSWWISNLATWVLSAVWHGFYPGYYFTFISGAIMNIASVKMRRLLWHHFQTSKMLICVYDMATWAVTHIFFDYGMICLPLLSFEKCITLWRYYYFFPITMIICVAVFPVSSEKKESSKHYKHD